MAELLQTSGESRENSLDSLVIKNRLRKRLNLNFNNVNSLKKNPNISPKAIDDIVKLSDEALKQQSVDTLKAAPAIDTSILYNSFSLSKLGNRKAAGNDAASSLISFSQVLFTNTSISILSRSVPQSIMDSFNANMDAVRNIDPEFSEKLFILLNAIAKLNPEDGEAIFRNINDILETFINLRNNLSQAAQGGTQSVPVQPQQAAPQQAPSQDPSFVLDIDIRVSEETEAILAELHNNGFTVISEKSEQTTNIHIRIAYGQPKQADPLVIDLGADGVDLTNVNNNPVIFDINGNGKMDAAAFVKGNDGLLAIDKNGNGRIDDGKELFGDQNGAANGFEELAKYDSNQNNMIDEGDEAYNNLRVIYDKNLDGNVAQDELSTLKELGINVIDLNYKSNPYDDNKGNSITDKSDVQKSDGTKINIYDVLLGFYG